MNKIQLQSDIPIHNAENYVFPRESKSSDTVKIKIEMPTRREIHDQIEICRRKAVQFAKKVGLITKHNIVSVACNVLPYVRKVPKQDLDQSDIKIPLHNELEVPILLKSGAYTNYADQFRDVSVSESSPFVEIDASKLNENKRSIVKKTFLCWLLRTSNVKLSSDRLLRIRVKAKVKKQSIKSHCEYARKLKCGGKLYGKAK